MNKLIPVCLWLCLLGGVTAPAAEVWHSIPSVARGPRDPDEVGAEVDAVAVRGGKEAKARVVVYGARESGILSIAVWIEGFGGLRDDDLEPYMVMNSGDEARNPRMMEFTLASATTKVQLNSPMIVLPTGNTPRGVDDDGYGVFAANCKNDQRFMALIHKMMEGFDRGVVWIGRGVYSPPIEVRFGGEGIRGPLQKVLDFVKPSKPTVFNSR